MPLRPEDFLVDTKDLPNYVLNGPSDPYPAAVTPVQATRLQAAGWRYEARSDVWWKPGKPVLAALEDALESLD